MGLRDKPHGMLGEHTEIFQVFMVFLVKPDQS